MTTKTKSKDTDQYARFVEAAREAGAEVDSAAADRLMVRLARTKPEPKTKVNNSKVKLTRSAE